MKVEERKKEISIENHRPHPLLPPQQQQQTQNQHIK